MVTLFPLSLIDFTTSFRKLYSPPKLFVIMSVFIFKHIQMHIQMHHPSLCHVFYVSWMCLGIIFLYMGGDECDVNHSNEHINMNNQGNYIELDP